MKTTFAFVMLFLATSAMADILVLPKLNESQSYIRVYSEAHMKKNPGQILREVEMTIYHSDEEDGIAQYSLSIIGVTRDGVKVDGLSGHCNELTSSLGLVCSIVDSVGDVLISDSPKEGMISLNIRNQNGKALSLLDADFNAVEIPANKDNRLYYLYVR